MKIASEVSIENSFGLLRVKLGNRKPFFLTASNQRYMQEHRLAVYQGMVELSGCAVLLDGDTCKFHQTWRTPLEKDVLLVVPWEGSPHNYCISLWDAHHNLPAINFYVVYGRLQAGKLTLTGAGLLEEFMDPDTIRSGKLGPHYLVRRELAEAQQPTDVLGQLW